MRVIPKLTELYAGAKASLEANLGTSPLFKSLINILATVWAGLLKICYVFLGNVQKNASYLDADLDMLRRYGMIYLKRLERPATQGQYECGVTGSAGAIIAANTTFLSNPTNMNPNYLFILDNEYTLTGSGDVITVRAITPGSESNQLVGEQLTCTSPLVNVNSVITVAVITVVAADGETTQEYRDAIGVHIHLDPQGGSVSDYILWGLDATGVVKIYPYTPSGSPWQVNVYVESALSSSGGTAPYYNYGIATSTQLTDVTAAILNDPVTSKARKPMGVVLGPSNVGALPIVVYQIVITFTGTGSMTTEQEDLITAALQAAVNKIRPFIGGADLLSNQNDTISLGLPAPGGRTTPPEKYIVPVIAIRAAPGAIFSGVSMTVDGNAETLYTFDDGIIPFLKNKTVGVIFS